MSLATDELLTNAFATLAQNPADAGMLRQIGEHFFAREQWPLAASYLEASAMLIPTPELDILRGHTAIRRMDYDLAEHCYARVLRWQPDHIIARAGLANCHYFKGQWTVAAAIYESLRDTVPNHPDLHLYLGRTYRQLLRLAESVAEYRSALALAATPEIYNELGWGLFEAGDADAADATYREALEKFPTNATLRFAYGFFLLHVGRWAEGFALYEERWKSFDLGAHSPLIELPMPNAPRWDGVAPLAGKTVIVFAEQGAGDLFMFIRYARELAALGAVVEVLTPSATTAVIQTVPWIHAVRDEHSVLPTYDYYVPLMSCPLYFGLTPQTIPAVDTPYIEAPYKQPRFSEKPTIGLVWAGNPRYDFEFYRSPGFEAMKPLIDAHPEYCFVALQVGPAAAQAAEYIAAGKLIDGAATIRNYGDTAAILTAMDSLITSCTSVAHLGGAMGVNTHLMLSACPDWRWLREGTNTAWYPSVTLHRQETLGDWAPVIAKLSR